MSEAEKTSERKPDRRLARTRSALLKAGEELFSQRARDAVTIDEIIEAADVSRASFYNHFKDKDDLAQAVLNIIREENSALVARHNIGHDRAADRIARALLINCRYAAERRERAVLLRESFFDLSTHRIERGRELARNLFKDIEEGIAVGEFHDLRTDVGVMLLVGLTNVAVEAVLAETADKHLVSGLAEGLLRALGLDWGEARKVTNAAGQDIFSESTIRLLKPRTRSSARPDENELAAN